MRRPRQSATVPAAPVGSNADVRMRHRRPSLANGELDGRKRSRSNDAPRDPFDQAIRAAVGQASHRTTCAA
jgi:hypothetical protein